MASQSQLEKCVDETRSLLQQQVTLDLQVLENMRWMHKERAYLAYGSPTFHHFCVNVLGMSEDSAWRRIHAAKLIDQFPEVVKPLIANGDVHLTGLALLDRVITPENGEQLIRESAGKSTTEIKAIVAREAPESGLSRVRRVARKQLSEQTWQFYAVMPKNVNERLQRITDMRGDDDYDAILDAALCLYETELRVRKQKALKRPQKINAKKAPAPVTAATSASVSADDAEVKPVETIADANPDDTTTPPAYEYRALTELGASVALEDAASMRRDESRFKRYIPRPLERFVRERDGHQCTYIGIDGRRCCARRHLEVHHIIAVALGGMTVVWNLTLLCSAHNKYQAELDLGDDVANAWRKSA